jgi:hypothetical protein
MHSALHCGHLPPAITCSQRSPALFIAIPHLRVVGTADVP